MVQLLYSPSTLCSHEAYIVYINLKKSLRKLNKVACNWHETHSFAPNKMVFQNQFYKMYVLLVASVVCHYHSCIISPLAALDVCFDLFGREQDLSVAYSRQGKNSTLNFLY